MNGLPVLLRLVGLTLLSSQAWTQSTWIVDPGSSGPGDGSPASPYSSLQYALLQPTTVSGDTLEIHAGTFFENVVHPDGKDDIRFHAAGNGEVVIDGMGLSSCYRLTASFVDQVTFEGNFRFSNGAGTAGSPGLAGGGIRVSGSDLILDGELGGITITGCSAELGGGIYISSGSLIAEGLQVTGNQAEQGAGVFVDAAHLSLTTSTVIDNTAMPVTGSDPVQGGGVYVRNGSLVLGDQGRVTGNVSRGDGGGISMHSSTLEIGSTGGVFENRAGDPPICSDGPTRGGGVLADAASTISGLPGSLIQGNRACVAGGGIAGGAMVSGVALVDNSAQLGGGVHGLGFVPEYTDCRFEDNQADPGSADVAEGGAAYSVSLRDCLILNNTASGRGGGTFDCELVNCTVAGNLSTQLRFAPVDSQGGGVFGGSALDCVIENNQAPLGGGAAAADLTGCTVRSNIAEVSPAGNLFALGGGIYLGSARSCQILDNLVTGTLDGSDLRGGGASNCLLEACLVQGNDAIDPVGHGATTARGGGLANCDALRCEIRDNYLFAQDTSGGGAIGGTLVSCLIVDNESCIGGGGASLCNLDRCTISGNTALIGSAVEGVTAISCILYGNDSDPLGGFPKSMTYSLVEGGFPGVGNIDLDPQFVDAANGDYHLQPSSPCIDTGDPATFDPDGSRADMGAFPLDPTGDIIGASVCFSNPNSTGVDAQLTIFGSPLVEDNQIILKATSLPNNSFGYYLMSALPDFIPLFSGSQGNLCLGVPELRFNDTVLYSGAAGQTIYQVDLNNLPLGAVVLPMETWYFQYWYRDRNPNQVTNTSSASALLFH